MASVQAALSVTTPASEARPKPFPAIASTADADTPRVCPHCGARALVWIAFEDVLDYRICEGPFQGSPTILDVQTVGSVEGRSRLRVDTDAGRASRVTPEVSGPAWLRFRLPAAQEDSP